MLVFFIPFCIRLKNQVKINLKLFLFYFNNTHLFKYIQDSVCLLHHLPLPVSSCLTGADVMVRARVLNCVDGVNVALLQKAINEQRSFFRERESKQGDAAQAADVT